MARNKQTILVRNNDLYLSPSEGRGRGVFCRKDIRKGEALEVTPGLLLGTAATAHAEKTRLKDYVFATGRVSKKIAAQEKIKDMTDSSCVVMGIASFCNHSDSPNAEVQWEEKPDGIYFTLRSLKNIPKNTEICTSYGPNWFEDRGLGKK